MAKPFEAAMATLNDFLALPQVHLPFRLRLDLLYYRCKLIALEESVKLLTPLRAIADGCSHTRLLINGLNQLTTSMASETVGRMASLITECQVKNLKRLEVEWRLVQVGFIVVGRDLGATSLSEELSADLSAQKNAIYTLCQTYPQTAGLLKPSYEQLGRFLVGTQRTGHIFYTKSTRNIWWTFPKHEIGNLKHCVRGHPYSGSSWPHCGECGEEMQQSVDSIKLLSKEDFVEAMKSPDRTFDGASYR